MLNMNKIDILKSNNCDVMVPEGSNGFQFQIGANLPNVLPWQFMIEFNPDDADTAQCRHDDCGTYPIEMRFPIF